MKKVIHIDGMTCGHCKARVEKALNAIPGVIASVQLAEKQATVQTTASISDDVLTAAVDDAGYDVISIEHIA